MYLEVKNIIIQEYQAVVVHERPILQKMPKGQIVVLYGKLEFLFYSNFMGVVPKWCDGGGGGEPKSSVDGGG